MRSLITIISAIILIATSINAQYAESFPLSNKGIISGPCGATYSTCISEDFTGVNWIISGDLSGIDSEGFKTVGSSGLESFDVDEKACWESPNLNINGVAVSSFTINWTLNGNWDSNSAAGSIDFMDVEYSIDGSPLIRIPNLSGCPASPHTVSGNECSGLSGPIPYTITETGITGNELKIFVCWDVNASAEGGTLTNVSVPEAGTILPVNWMDFNGKFTNEGIHIKWSTLSEINNDYFEIERSPDGKDFETIGEQASKSNSTTKQNYSFLDQDPTIYSNYEHYYRIKQIDLDGQFTYGALIRVVIPQNDDVSIVFLPNVTHDYTSFYIEGDTEDLAILEVYNSFGQIIESIDLKQKGMQFVQINAATLPKGRYFSRILKDNGQVVQIKPSSFTKI